MYKLKICFVFLSMICSVFAQNTFSTDHCPTAELIKPCTCFKNSMDDDAVECRGLKSHEDIRTIFNRVPGWKFTILYVLDSTMLYLPSSIFENTSITNLNVSGSTMVSLFDEPPKSSNLRNIYVVGSTFQRGFRWNLVSSLNIESLVLYHTPLKALGPTFMNNIPPSTTDLKFEDNKISRFVNQPFEKMKNLKTLRLGNQSFKEIKSLKFPESLVHIGLYSNDLQTLPEGFFSGLPNLQLVNLNYNKFSTIDEGSFQGVKFIQLYDNPLNCNCLMKWFVTKRDPRYNVFSMGTCASPVNLQGRELKSLTASDFSYCG